MFYLRNEIFINTHFFLLLKFFAFFVSVSCIQSCNHHLLTRAALLFELDGWLGCIKVLNRKTCIDAKLLSSRLRTLVEEEQSVSINKYFESRQKITDDTHIIKNIDYTYAI